VKDKPLAVRVDVGGELLAGTPSYSSSTRALELPARPAAATDRVKTLALGKLVLALDYQTQRLLGLTAFLPASRWGISECGPPPPDTQGSLGFTLDFGADDFRFYDLPPRCYFHESSGSLQVKLGEGGVLAVRTGLRLVAGLSREGGLTDLWLEGLRFRA
jgi:hypothetical protein